MAAQLLGDLFDLAEADGGEATSDWSPAAAADARAERGARTLAAKGAGGVLQLPRRAGQHAGDALVSTASGATLASGVEAAQPAELPAMGGFLAVVDPVRPLAQCAPSVSLGSICRHLSEIGAVCGKAACTDLCGGRRVTAVPTATRVGTPADACMVAVLGLFQDSTAGEVCPA